MAYFPVYQANWASKTKSGTLVISRVMGSSNPPTILTLAADSLIVTYDAEDWEYPILHLKCEFEIINTFSDFFTLLPLMNSPSNYWKVTVVTTSPTAQTIFEGFLNCEAVSQGFLLKQPIRLLASCALSKLDNVSPALLDTQLISTYLFIIDQILRSTGSIYDIMVNCSLYGRNVDHESGKTLFSTCGFWTELFWENNVDRTSSLDILKSILTTFDCYLYWFDNHWYIEQYRDINPVTESITYIEYDSTDVMEVDTHVGSATIISKPINSMHDFIFTDTTQTMTIIPGCDLVKISLNDKLFDNLTNNDFSNPLEYTGDAPYPPLRKWSLDDTSILGGSWVNKGESYWTIQNSIKRHGGYVSGALATHFIATVESTSYVETELTIRFKICTFPAALPGYVEGEEPDMSKYTFNIYWSLSNGTHYLCFDSDTGLWSLVEMGNGYILYGRQTTVINGEAFEYNKFLGLSYEVSLNVPIGNILAVNNETHFVFRFGEELVECTGEVSNHCETAIYGDVFITASGELQSNLIQGVSSGLWKDKKEATIDLFDIDNFNFKNGILYDIFLDVWNNIGDYLYTVERTTDWTIDGTNYYTIVEWLMKDYWQRKINSFQKVTSDMYFIGTMKPLLTIQDALQSNKEFNVLSYSYHLCTDMYTSVVIIEYSRVSINLIG